MGKQKANEFILTRRQTADFLSISLTTLKKWSDQKVLKPYQMGGRIYFKRQEILKALKSGAP
jgi:excisionase family DNA binding protein